MNYRMILCGALLVLAPLTVWSIELSRALESFASYSFGQHKQLLHDARMAAFRGTQDAAVRARNEQLLLEFLESSASVDAKREACVWLSELAGPASRERLVILAQDPQFEDVARMVLESLKPSLQKAPAVSTETGDFKAQVLASEQPEALLIDAIRGERSELARLAFYLAEEGVASVELAQWLSLQAQTLESTKQLLALNLLKSLDADELEALSAKLVRVGYGQVQLRAIELSTDTALLREFLLGADKPQSGAAQQALVALSIEAAEPVIRSLLGSNDVAIQAKGIAIAAARTESGFSKDLEAIAVRDGANQQAAIRALGVVGVLGGFELMLDRYIEAEGQPIQKAWQAAVWDMSRRQPDLHGAVKALQLAAESASANSKNALLTMAKRLEGSEVPLKMGRAPGAVPKTVQRPVSENVLVPGSFRDLVPARFEVAGYVNCGPETQASNGSVKIAAIGGSPFRTEPSTDPSFSLLYAPKTIDFTISGLEAGEDYILGMTWWDDNTGNRVQSVFINETEVLPAAPAISYDEHDRTRDKKHRLLGRASPMRLQFALQPEHIKNGSCKVRVEKLAGPNVVVSECWVLQRSKPKAEKQVLLITGQDFPGHHWRKTSQVMAKLIAEDPRMEVTICETPYVLGLRDLSAYDVLFIHFKNYDSSMPSTKRMRANLQDYVLDGGGMCLSHFACGAFMEWPEFVGLSGRVWSRGGHDPRRPFTVNVVDQQHPVTQGLGASFETDDELYWCLTGDPEIHLLCDAMSTAKNAKQPQALVFEPGKGRSFLCTLGHDVKAYDATEVRRLYRQGTAWAAGLE